MSTLFSLCNLTVMPFWLAMLLFPRARATRAAMDKPWVCLLPALIYSALVIPQLPAVMPILMKPTLEGVMALLGTPAGATAGWVHYLCFDLWVGRHIFLESQHQPRWRNTVVLFCTLMLGPLGWLLHQLTRQRLNPLRTLTLFCLVGALAALAGLALDPRVITGAPAWLKPLKFFLAVALYAPTLEWMLGYVRSRWIAPVTAGILTGELVLIALQAARGTTSHFNQDTPFDALIYSAMGIGIGIVWVQSMVLSWRLARNPDLDPALREGLVWAGFTTAVGMGVAWIMTAIGSHTMGAPDGGPGLPLLGWSTLAGDLRAPHFIGLHALQVVPLLSLLSGRPRLVGSAFLGLVIIATWQALRGEPFAHPGLATLLALAAWSALVAAAARRAPECVTAPL